MLLAPVKADGIYMMNSKNINTEINRLSDIYHSLDKFERSKFFTLLDLFIKAVRKKSDHSELIKFLDSYINKGKDKNSDTYSFKKIRSLIASRKEIPQRDYERINEFIWKILPELSLFRDINELNNFLSYILNFEAKYHPRLKNKRKLTDIYKKFYDSLDKDERDEIFRDLALRVFAEVSKKERDRYMEKN
ncbi:hypothetical protein QUF72_17460 [Desulfobacterales bacterium HSG2]|nr:hypothetical protein [Desulfobacterales bacterium HSG2]